MAKKKRGNAHTGGHGWFVTFADLMGLMMSFFVMLVAFSNQDQQKLKIVACSMREAFGVQTEARYSGVIESDGLPTRPKLKNVAHIQPQHADPGRETAQPQQRRETENRS
jgi:chemotaxis protein MotB